MERLDSASEISNPINHIALFASGNGSNAKKIIEYFTGNEHIIVKLVVCNKTGAGVIKIAHDYDIPVLMIEKERFFRGDSYLNELQAYNIKFIVLAGFLWKIPEAIIRQYRNRIINIHPALLPKYGGKGMYGSHVHRAVIDAHDTESGITIHYVDEQYDHGDVIFQAKCPVLSTDDADSLAEKIHRLEHENFPRIIEECVNGLG
jgi:phosphoribosylglycinamide formyltransferase-1